MPLFHFYFKKKYGFYETYEIKTSTRLMVHMNHQPTHFNQMLSTKQDQLRFLIFHIEQLTFGTKCDHFSYRSIVCLTRYIISCIRLY